MVPQLGPGFSWQRQGVEHVALGYMPSLFSLVGSRYTAWGDDASRVKGLKLYSVRTGSRCDVNEGVGEGHVTVVIHTNFSDDVTGRIRSDHTA